MATAQNSINPPLKWHGGKHYLARRIVGLMPEHLHYVEPYFGGGSVLLAKEPDGVSEVVNDIDGRLMNFWQVLKDEDAFARFHRAIEATPFSEPAWNAAHDDDPGVINDPVADALAFFVACRQSLAGRRDSFASISRSRVRRGMNEQTSAWLTAVECLPAVHARLRRVLIVDRSALDVIRSEDTQKTLFYLDPPYLHETRSARGAYGANEMTEQDHRDLLERLQHVQGKVMLSGYRSDLYDTALSDWTCHEFDLPNNAAAGSSKRRMTECLWCNF